MCGLVCPSRTSDGWLVQAQSPAQSPAQRGSGAHPAAGYVCFLQVCVCVFITAGSITKLFAWGDVLQESMRSPDLRHREKRRKHLC
jgi:hypothetical protein